MVIKIFAMAYIIFPLRINSTVSKLKEEKVLKPPQIPVIIKNFMLLVSGFEFSNATVTARIIQLKIFEASVAMGNEVLKRLGMYNEIP